MNIIENFHNRDAIAAISTGGGQSAIAVIRCSGKDVFDKIDSIFKPAKEYINIESLKGYEQVYGQIIDNETIIDQVILSVFKEPHSFTGENVIEINCHGSTYIQKKIMSLLVDHGFRPATKGEFTLRAWKNGKYDLAQAEAIADLIESNNELAHNVAMRHLRGNFSSLIKDLRDEFIHFASLLELELDFAEEDVEFANRHYFNELILKIEKQLKSLHESFKIGRVIKEGIPVAIIGSPNVGKSTLLNQLLQEDKAITSEIPGTTRDIIEDTVIIDGYLFRFIDTAGIRNSNDTIENLGIERTLKTIKEASIIIYMADQYGFYDVDVERIESYLADNKFVISVQNKMDILINDLEEKNNIIKISALNGDNIQQITTLLVSYIEEQRLNFESIVTSERHAFILSKTLEDLQNIKNGFANGVPSDLIAIDVRYAMDHLGTITGQIHVEDLLSNIFSKFCIGK